MTQEFKIQAELMNKALDKLPKYQSNEMLYRIENLTEHQLRKEFSQKAPQMSLTLRNFFIV